MSDRIRIVRNKVWRMTVAAALVLMATASLGISISIQGYTLVEWWKPVCGCGLLGLVASGRLHKAMRRLTGTTGAALNYAAAFVLSFSMVSGCFYAVNFYQSDAGSRQVCSALVVSKYAKEHYRVRRVSRHTAARGEKYYTYHVGVRLPDGREKSVAMPVDEYVKVRKGQRVSISVEEGLFGIPVIKGRRFPVTKYKRL